MDNIDIHGMNLRECAKATLGPIEFAIYVQKCNSCAHYVCVDINAILKVYFALDMFFPVVLDTAVWQQSLVNVLR